MHSINRHSTDFKRLFFVSNHFNLSFFKCLILIIFMSWFFICPFLKWLLLIDHPLREQSYFDQAFFKSCYLLGHFSKGRFKKPFLNSHFSISWSFPKIYLFLCYLDHWSAGMPPNSKFRRFGFERFCTDEEWRRHDADVKADDIKNSSIWVRVCFLRLGTASVWGIGSDSELGTFGYRFLVSELWPNRGRISRFLE